MSWWRFQNTWLDFPETRTIEDVGLPGMADCGGILKVLVFQKRMRVGSTEEKKARAFRGSTTVTPACRGSWGT